MFSTLKYSLPPFFQTPWEPEESGGCLSQLRILCLSSSKYYTTLSTKSASRREIRVHTSWKDKVKAINYFHIEDLKEYVNFVLYLFCQRNTSNPTAERVGKKKSLKIMLGYFPLLFDLTLEVGDYLFSVK